MAQTILELITNNSIADGIYINIIETVDGVEKTVPYLVFGHNMHETSEDSVMLLRSMSIGAKRMHSENVPEYENCEIDQYLNSEFINRYSADLRSAILNAGIKVISNEDDGVYQIARKIFLPSIHEWGFVGVYGVDGIASPYATTNEKRKMKDENRSFITHRTRSKKTTTNFANITEQGADGGYYHAGWAGYHIIPAFDLSTSLTVSSEPNEDGTYNLIGIESAIPCIDFEVRAGESNTRYVAAKVSVMIETETETETETHLYVCNNYNDASPTWEEASFDKTHTFVNDVKTAEAWALGIRIVVNSENTIAVYEPFIMWTHKEAQA